MLSKEIQNQQALIITGLITDLIQGLRLSQTFPL